MMRVVVPAVMVVVICGAVLLGSAGSSGAGSDAGDAPYTLLALERLDLGKGTRVSGSVGVADGRLRLRNSVSVAGTATAPHVVLRSRTSVDRLRCDVVTGGTLRCEPMPVIDTSMFVAPDVTPGPDDIRVPKNSRHVPLVPGTYGKLEVGKHSDMPLAGGDYVFQSIRIGKGSTLECQAPCSVSVRRGVRIAHKAVVSGSGLDLQVAGRGGAAVVIGSKASVSGLLYAPTAPVKLRERVTLRATIVARSVRVGARARISPVDPAATAE